MKRDKHQQTWRQKLLKFKESYVLGKYQDLVIHDQYMYPPVEKSIEQILVSQFGFSLLDQFIRNYHEQRFDKKNKLPLPIVFAIIHHHLKISKYQNLIKIILHHVDRTVASKYYIVTYVIAKIYEKFKQYKKSIFYLQNVLKEEPFFYEAIYDLCYSYAFRFQRQQQACILLERHINQSQLSNKLILPLYLCICSKFKIRTAKDVVKLLHNKSMNIASYFNLGLFLRHNDDSDKAQQIFTEIIAKLTKAKLQKYIFSTKDEKILILSKINLFMIFQQRKNTSISMKNIQFYSKSIINDHKECLDAQTLSRLTQYSLKHTFTQFSKPHSQIQLKTLNSTRQQKSTPKVYKKQITQNVQKSAQNQQNMSRLNTFNKQFTNIRQQNSKKLKYLLQKQKQINQFFKNLVIKKDPSNDKYSIEYKIKDKTIKIANQSIISKAKYVPSQYEAFQKEFQSKRKIHEFKYSNFQLKSMLSQILANFEDCLFSNKKGYSVNQFKKQNLKTIQPKISIKKPSNPHSKYSSILVDENISQISQKKIEKERKWLKTSKNKGYLKSERNGYCFRIKQTNKQSKQLRQQQEEQKVAKAKRQYICSEMHSPKKIQNIKQFGPILQQKIIQQQLKKQDKSEKKLHELKQQPLQLYKQLPGLDKDILQNQEVLAVNAQAQIIDNNKKSQQICYEKKQRLQDQQKSHQLLFSQTNCIEMTQKSLEVNNPPEIISWPEKEQTDKSLELQKQPEIIANKQSQQIQSSSKSLAEQLQINDQQHKQEQEQIKSYKYQKKQQVIFQQQEQIIENSQDKPVLPNPHNQVKQILKTNQKDQQNQQQNQIVSQSPQILNEVQSKTQQNQQLTPPQQRPYDPFASTFQLTGFNKSSLSKFRQVKKKRDNSIQLNKKVDFPVLQHKGQVEKLSTQFQNELKKAQDLYKQQKYQKAFELLTRIYKSFKKESQKQIVLIKIGSLFEKQQKFAQAEKTYLKCTKFNNVDAFLKLGALLINNGRINSGVQNIEKANCIKRNDIQIQNRLVYGYSLRQETMQKALTLAQMILKKEPQSLQTLIITANILQKQGKIKEAIQILTAIDKFKEAEYIKHYLGILYLQDSNLTEAFNYFKAALAIKPDFIPSLIEVATIISQISPKQSISILRKVLQVEPQNRKVLARLGKIYESIQNDFENAMIAYQTALETQENYQSYIKIGDCLAKQQSYIQALINYKQALNLRKTHEAYAKVANMYEKKYQLAKAIESYELALQLICKQKQGGINSIKKKEYLIFLGNLNIKIGNYDASIKFFEEIQDHTESIDILKLLAEAYFGQKQYSMALQRFEKANQLAHGESLQLLQKIAICFDKMEEYMASKPIYEKILEKDPNNIRCMNNLANILLIIGETNESFYLFESMLQKAPKNLQKRLKVADIYAQVGDWSKVQFHLLQCLKLKEGDQRVIERLINLYKQKRDTKMVAKYEKKLIIIKNTRKNQQKKQVSS